MKAIILIIIMINILFIQGSTKLKKFKKSEDIVPYDDLNDIVIAYSTKGCEDKTERCNYVSSKFDIMLKLKNYFNFLPDKMILYINDESTGILLYKNEYPKHENYSFHQNDKDDYYPNKENTAKIVKLIAEDKNYAFIKLKDPKSKDDPIETGIKIVLLNRDTQIIALSLRASLMEINEDKYLKLAINFVDSLIVNVKNQNDYFIVFFFEEPKILKQYIKYINNNKCNKIFYPDNIKFCENIKNFNQSNYIVMNLKDRYGAGFKNKLRDNIIGSDKIKENAYMSDEQSGRYGGYAVNILLEYDDSHKKILKKNLVNNKRNDFPRETLLFIDIVNEILEASEKLKKENNN